MKLRTRLLLPIVMVIVLGVSGVTWGLYVLASRQLVASAKTDLEQAAYLLARQSENWFDSFSSTVAGWSAMPLIGEAVAAPGSAAPVECANRYFQELVGQFPILQTVNLLDTNANCLASSIPSRIGLAEMKEMVEKRPDFIDALSGKVAVSGAIWGHSTQRPVVAISAPVRVNGRVQGVLRAIIDLAFYNEQFLKPLLIGGTGHAFTFDPEMEFKKSPEPRIWDVISHKDYVLPDIPLSGALLTREHGILNHGHGKNARLAAFQRARRPNWVFVVEKSLSEIYRPVRMVRGMAVMLGICMLLAAWMAVWRITRPIIRDMELCARFAQDIGQGRYPNRLETSSTCEIAMLGQCLNTMAEDIRSHQAKLRIAEAQYRGIFENASEGMAQTDDESVIHMANPAFVRMLGFDRPEQVCGRKLLDFYADPDCRRELLEMLSHSGVVRNFAVEFVRNDGRKILAELYAQSEKELQGRTQRIHVIMHDVTEQRKAEETRRRLGELEGLLAQAQLQMLRLQLNPHFLFNAFNSLDALVVRDPAAARQMIRQLAAFCRASLLLKNNGLSSLGEELELVGQYLAIEKVRWGDALQYEFDVEPGLADQKIPAFILQPLAGNAVKYGQLSGADPLRIQVSARRQAGSILLEVANRGHWFKPGECRDGSSSGIGLPNVERRLQNLFSNGCRIESREEDGWVKVRLVLPERNDHES